MSTPLSKSTVLEDDDDDQDYIPVGVLQLSSSFKPEAPRFEQIPTHQPLPSNDHNVQESSYNLKHQQNQQSSAPQTNYSQYDQLGLQEFGQGQRKSEGIEINRPFQPPVQKNPHVQSLEKDNMLRRPGREQEEKQDQLPQYKLLLQLMQQKQRAQAHGINSNQGNQGPVKLQARVITSPAVQNNSSPENQRHMHKRSSEDLNSNVPVESQNQLLKILTLAQRDQQSGQKNDQNSMAGNRTNPNTENPSNIFQGSVKQNLPRHVGRDSPITSKAALRIDITPNFQHIPRSSEYLPQQSPTSSAAVFNPYHPNMNNQHPEITKRLNSPVSPGRQSTSPRQAVSPRHTGGSPRQVSSSPCQFISPKQPVSPRGTTVVSSRKSQPSSPQPIYHSPNPKAQSGFSWQPTIPSSTSQMVVPARRVIGTSSNQDLPISVSHFQNPLNSPATLTQEATVENIHHHPSKFQPISSDTRRRTLSGGIVHHRTDVEATPQCQINFTPYIAPPNGPFLKDTASSVSQNSAISFDKPHTPQTTVSPIVSNSELNRPAPKDNFESSTRVGSDQCSNITLSKVPSPQNSTTGSECVIPSSTDVGSTHFSTNQNTISKSDLSDSRSQINLDSTERNEESGCALEKHKSEAPESESVSNNSEDKSKEKVSDVQAKELDERLQSRSGTKRNESNESMDKVKGDKKQNASKDKETVVIKNSHNREMERLENSDSASIRETSSKRLRKPKVPFEDSGSVTGKTKKNNKPDAKRSQGKISRKVEKHQQQLRVLKSSTSLKQSVLTRSSLRHKGNKKQLIKNSDRIENRGQLLKRTLRGSELKMKSNRYLITRKVDKETELKQKIGDALGKDSDKVVKNGNKNLRATKQEQKKGSEVSMKGKNGKDNKDLKDTKKGNDSSLDQKKHNGKDTKNEHKKTNESRGREQRSGSDAASKRFDKELKNNSSKDSSSATDNETNTRSSTRLSTRQSGNSDDKNKNGNTSNSRSRSRTREASEESKLQNDRISTRGSKIFENPTVSLERVSTRANKSLEQVKDSKSTKTVSKDLKTDELSTEQKSASPNPRVSTRGSKNQESSSAEGDSTTKEKLGAKGVKSNNIHKDSSSTTNDRVVTRGLKTLETADSTLNERISTRNVKTPNQTTASSDKTPTRVMTTRQSDGVKGAHKRPIPASESSSALPRKRTRSEEVRTKVEKGAVQKSESRPRRSKPGFHKVKHDFRNSDEDEEYNAEDDDEGDSSDDRISPTTTRSGRVTSTAPKRKISMRLRREASKRKYNMEEESISDDESNESDESDDSNSESENESGSDTDVETRKGERNYPSRRGDKKIELLLNPKPTADVVKEDVSITQPPDLSKMRGYKLVPLTAEEMSSLPGKDSMLPLDGFIVPGTDCIVFPAHFTRHIRVDSPSTDTNSTTPTSQPTRVLSTPRPISSVTESSSSVRTSTLSSQPLPASSSSSISSSGTHQHTPGYKNQSVIPSAPTPPPAVSLSSSSSIVPSSSIPRLTSSVASTNPWNSPSLPTPPPSVSSSSSHSSSSWNHVPNLQPWMSDGSTPGSTAWNESTAGNPNEGWRGNNNSSNSQNNAYLQRGSYNNNVLPMNTESASMHDSSSQRLHDLPSSGQDPLYINERVAASSPPVEAGLFRDASNLSPSGYNIALPGLGQQDISYLESKLQQEMDMSSMLLSDVPYDDEIPEPPVHHGIPVCSVNLDDAEVDGRLANVPSTLHLPSGSRGLDNNVNVNNMQQQHQPHNQQVQQQQMHQQKQPTGFLEELMTDPLADPAVTVPGAMESNANVVGNSGEKSLMNTKRHLYEVIVKDDKKYGYCKICNGSFSLTSIYRHLKKHEDPNTGISCTMCGKRYSQKHNLVSHMKKIHNVGADSPSDAREEEKKKEVSERTPKSEHSDSLDSLSVDKPAVQQPSTESDSQMDSKDGSETKDGKKKPRKRSVDRKYTKDGLVYELMPESPSPINIRHKRRTQRQVERVRRMKAKQKYEAGKNVNGITYDLSQLDDDTSSGNDNDDDDSDMEMEEDVDEKATIDDGDNSDKKPNLDGVENDLGDGLDIKSSQIMSASSTASTTKPLLSSNMESVQKTENPCYDTSKNINPSRGTGDTNVGSKEPGSANVTPPTWTATEGVDQSPMVGEEGVMEEMESDSNISKADTAMTSTPNSTSGTKEKYPCSLCSSVLASKCSFFLHMKRHKSVKDKVCNYCGKGFITGQELRSHERTHTGERPFSCEICKYTFAHQGSYQAHKKGHIKRGEFEPFPPEKCYNEGQLQQPNRRRKRAQSDGLGPKAKQKEDDSAVSGSSDISAISSPDKDNSGNVNSIQRSVSGGSSGSMAGSDPILRRRSLDSAGMSQQQQSFDQQHMSGGMRSPAWPTTPNTGTGGSPWESRPASSEQTPQNMPPNRTPAANFREQSSPSFYSPSPTYYGPSSGADSPMMSPNISGHPSNQIPTEGMSQHPSNYRPQSSPQHQQPHQHRQHPQQQHMPTPHSPHIPQNMNSLKSPTHEPNYPSGNVNQVYPGGAAGGNYDDGRLFASPGPPPPSATLVHPRKQQQQKQQMPPRPPQNYSPSQQYNMYGPAAPSSSNSSSNSYSQPVHQQPPAQPQQQQQHRHHHPQQQRGEQSDDIVNTLLNQYNIPPASQYTGNTRQMQPSPQQQQRLQPSQQQPQKQQMTPQFHHQNQQKQQYHQYRESPNMQQQHQQQQHQQPPSSGQHNVKQQQQQQFAPPPPYKPNQSKPPPPYPASYNEFYRSPQHTDDTPQQAQPPQKQQQTNMESPSMHQQQHTPHHQGFNTPSSYSQFQTGGHSPQTANPTTAQLNRSIPNQPASTDISNRPLSSPTANFNQQIHQQGVRPAQLNPPIHSPSPSLNPQHQQQQQQAVYHHHPSPSSTPSPGYFHQGTPPSTSG